MVLLAAGSTCPAATPPARENAAVSGELRFRRVYFPEGTQAWPQGNEKYLPMDGAEFERLLAAIQHTTTGALPQASVGFVAAQYEARLKGQTLQGSATLDVSPAIASAMLMNLDPCNLAIARAQWVTSDGAPAVLGITGDGKLQLLAERGTGAPSTLGRTGSGQVKFDWSLAGQADAAGGVNFAIALPPSPVNRMLVELPAGWTPTVDRGIVSDEGPMDADFHRFRLDLGGRPGCRLRLAKAGSMEVRPQAVLASQATTYDFSLRGVELSVKLAIESHREPLRRVALGLDPALELIEVSAGGVPLAWSVANQADKSRQATIEIPAALQEGAAKLQLRAIAPLTMNGSWKLPRLDVAGIVFRSNTIRLSVPLPLCIERLETRACRQTGVSPLTTTAGEQLDFTALAANAAIEVSLSQRAAQVQALSATATLLGQGKMSSRVATDFHTGEGPVFALEASVLPSWTIDSVESQPTDGLDDWTLEGVPGAPGRGNSQRLTVRLARPLTAARPLRLIVAARRLYAVPGRNLGIDDLVPLRFSGLAQSKRWVDLYASGSNELRFTAGDHLQRADAKDLTAAELDLFAEPPGDLLFLDDPGTAGLRLSLESRRPTYSATIRAEAIAGGDELTENYSFACRPSKAAPIDRVVVHFAGHREGRLTWSVAGMDESRFVARRWSAEQESSAGLTADEENWDVTFRSPRSAAVEIRASRKTKLAAGTIYSWSAAVCLAALPDAAEQEAMLVVRSLGPQIVQIKTRRLKLLPTEAAPAGQVQTARATYQYDPKTEATPQPDPAIVLTAVGKESAAAWVWDCDVRSQVAADGTADHLLTYRIQNTGSRQIRLTLPEGLTRRDVHGIWVNDKPAATKGSDPFSQPSTSLAKEGRPEKMDLTPLSPGGTDPGAGELAVDLPEDLKFVTLVVRLATREKPLGIFSRLRPPLPEIGLPVFARHWRLELPPGYATCSYGPDSQAAVATFSLRRCLLGPLGRSENQPAFNPLRREDWQSALHWPAEDRRADPAGDAAGWTQYPVDLDDGRATVIVVRRAAVDAAGWMLFLSLVGIGRWGLSRRPLVLLSVAVVLGLPALLLPETLAAIFSRGLLGVMFCLLLGLVRRVGRYSWSAAGPAVSAPGPELPSTLASFLPYGAPLLAAAMLCGGDSAGAGEPARSPPPAHAVFIPVDANQKPTPGKYYLPEPFFDELYRRAALQAEKPQGWMIASAVYRAALVEDPAQARHVVDRLTAEFEIRVFNAAGAPGNAGRVRIPLRRDEVSLEPGQVQLDERPVQPDWEADGGALLLEIAEPGEYHLELTLRPVAQPGNHPAGLDLAIPRVPISRLELSVPAGGPQVEFPSALGAVRWEEVMSRWTAELGPADRLAVHWPDAAPAGAAIVDAEQLLWLKIEPGCVLLDARINAKAAAGQIRRLLVRADPALELLPTSGPLAPVAQPRGSDPLQTYEIRWPGTRYPWSGTGPTASVDLHFLWSGVPSSGAFRVPQIEVVDARPVRRSLAVSVDPALEYQMPAARFRDSAALQEFIDHWGTSDSPPAMAFRLNESAAEWSLVTRARQPETSGEQHLNWSFNARTAELQFDAQLTAAGGSLFQYRLDAPPTLHVDALAVLAEGVNQAARWSQNSDGQVSVFLASPLSGRHEIQLQGQMPLPRNRIWAMPKVRLLDVRMQNSLVGLYRRPDVLIDVSGVGALPDVKTTADEGQADRGRPVRSFYADPAAAPPVTVTVRANRPRLRAEQVTRVEYEDNEWHTTCECRLRVSAGLLDAVEVDVPAAWRDSVTASPAMDGTFAATTDDWVGLALSPSAAISGDFRFTLTGPSAAAARFLVPKVALKHADAGGLKKYVILPNSADHQPVAWAVQNLRRSEAQAAAEDAVRYEVVGEPWQASLLPPRKTAPVTRVVQADVRYAWQADGRCLGAAFLDVETAAALDCALELPPGFELLQFTVDGLPVDAVRRPAADDAPAAPWMVPLASQASTSRVEMLFFAASAIPQSLPGWPRRCSFVAPKLGDLPVERTVWTIAAPHTFQPAEGEKGSDTVSQEQGGFSRVGGRENGSDPFLSGDIAAQWQRFVAEGEASVSYAAPGPNDVVAIEYRPIEPRAWLPRLAGIAGFLVIIGLAGLIVRLGLLRSLIVRWPAVFGVGFGLAWWLWLSPSAVGLLIVLVVLLCRFLPRKLFGRPAAAAG